MHIHENAEEINGFTKIWVDTKTCRAQPSGAVSTHRYTTWHDRGEQQKLEKQWGGGRFRAVRRSGLSSSFMSGKRLLMENLIISYSFFLLSTIWCHMKYIEIWSRICQYPAFDPAKHAHPQNLAVRRVASRGTKKTQSLLHIWAWVKSVLKSTPP